MATPLGTEEDREEVSILERILKILIVVLAMSFLYSYVEPIFSEITSNAQRDRVTRDFQVIGDAMSRYHLTSGKQLSITSLQPLVDEKVLAELPKDPWGSEYIYNWYFDELVSKGPDRKLDSFVLGVRDEPSVTDGDDKVKNVSPPSSFVYFANTAGSGKIWKAPISGLGPVSLEEIPGEIQSLSVLPSSKKIVYSVKRGAGNHLRVFDFGTNERQQLTDGAYRDRNPTWASPRNDQIVFASNREAQSGEHLFLMTLRDGTLLKLGNETYSDPAPSVLLEGRRTVYFGKRAAEQSSIMQMRLPETSAQEVFSRPETLSRPTPSPDGIYLAFISQTSRGTAFEVIELKSKQQVFRKEGASPKGWIAWSPEGDKVAYQIDEGTGARIVLVHPATKTAVTHPQFVMALGRFAWIK